MELILIRHGEPVKDEGGPGPADPSLSPRGWQQALLLAQSLAAEGTEEIYSSPMARARQTAEPLGAAVGKEIVVRDDLAEFDRLARSYIPLEEMREAGDPRYLAMVAGDFNAYGVDMAQFRRTVVAQIETIVSTHPGGRVAVVCHGGVINAYIGHILGLERHTFFAPDYTSVSRVAARRSGTRSLVRLNEISHLSHAAPAPWPSGDHRSGNG